MTNYDIYIEDKVTGKAIQLDSVDVDFTTTFAIADVRDLLVRRDVITKDLVFKFSDVNNAAFGYSFMNNKYVDEADNTPTLGGNYNPQIAVPCSVYENGLLVLKGNLRLKRVKKDTYECVITGNVIEFTSKIGESVLDDIDLSDTVHTYNMSNIQASWVGDKDYVYPAIQYGVPFRDSSKLNGIANPFNLYNFKPAIFVKSVFKRIFSSIGFRYEVRGDEQFLNLFNRLIVPNNRKLSNSLITTSGTTKPLSFTKANDAETKDTAYAGSVGGTLGFFLDIRLNRVDTLNLMNLSATPFGAVGVNLKPYTIFSPRQTFTSTCTFNYSIQYRNAYNPQEPIMAHTVLYERDAVAESNSDAFRSLEGWDVVVEKTFQLLSTGRGDVNTGEQIINIPERTWSVGKQYRLAYVEYTTASINMINDNHYFIITSMDLSFPTLIGQTISIETTLGGAITPTLPTGVKQLDFINSICGIFNLYKYVDQDDDKKIVFEPYDSYYQLAKESNLIANTKEWTKYVDYNGDYSNDSNLDIVKNYNFKWKSDKDYNKNYYQEKYSRTYGDMQISDSRGILEKKEISLIFSPTPMGSSYSATGTPYFGLPVPYMYGVTSSGDVENIDTNIRLLIWNGTQTVNTYNIISETFNIPTGAWQTTGTAITTLPVASNYLFDTATKTIPLFDLHFGAPNELFILKPTAFDSINYSYTYYQNQINELKSGNVTFLTCQMYLNELEIANLSLKTPVFIDLGRNGYSYWKVLSVEYTNAESRSTVKLQKIV